MLGNQLIIHAHLYAFAKEYNILFFNPSFFYGQYFPNFKKIKLQKVIFILFRFFTKLLLKFNLSLPYCKIVFIDWHEKVELNEHFYHQYFTNNKFVFLTGWQFRNSSLIMKYKNDIKTIFQPPIDINNNLTNTITQYKESFQNIVAVHIRRGDYINFEGGRFFYHLQVYEQLIQHLEKCIFTDKKNLFLIFSNENLQITLQNTNYRMVKGTPIEDLYLMSMCDYIIGPPSTFSIWASFYGNVPLYMVHHPADYPKNLSDFKPAEI